VKELRLTHNGKPYRVRALSAGTNLWLHVNGETYVIDLAPARSKSGSGKTAETSNQLLAPMPGKIRKVSAKAGDHVEAGQVIVIMEAMKMEYSLTASRRGRVKSVMAKENDQVELNQLLAELEDESRGVSK